MIISDLRGVFKEEIDMQKPTNNEKFCQLLNSSANPRAIYNALFALAPLLKEELRKAHGKAGDAA